MKYYKVKHITRRILCCDYLKESQLKGLAIVEKKEVTKKVYEKKIKELAHSTFVILPK